MSVVDPAQLQHEKERLEHENTELRERLRWGWWRRGAVVIAMTAILAAVPPLTSAVRARFDVERDLALQDSRQRHEQAMEHERQLDRLRAAYLDPQKTPTDRLRALRVLIASAPDAALEKWASAEAARLESEPKEPPLRPASPALENLPPRPPAPPPAPAKLSREPARTPRALPPPAAEEQSDRMALKGDPY